MGGLLTLRADDKAIHEKPKLPKHHYIPVFYLREWTRVHAQGYPRRF